MEKRFSYIPPGQKFTVADGAPSGSGPRVYAFDILNETETSVRLPDSEGFRGKKMRHFRRKEGSYHGEPVFRTAEEALAAMVDRARSVKAGAEIGLEEAVNELEAVEEYAEKYPHGVPS